MFIPEFTVQALVEYAKKVLGDDVESSGGSGGYAPSRPSYDYAPPAAPDRRILREPVPQDDPPYRAPEAHRPALGTLFKRTQVVDLELPPVRKVENLAAVLFERADPQPRP